MDTLIVILVILIVAAAGGALYLRWRVRQFSRRLFGTADLAEGLREARLTADATPKSLAALTRVLLPQIQRDFPAFSWEEYRQKVRNDVQRFLVDAYGTVRTELHDTEISDYRNQAGSCYIRCQTAAGHAAEDGAWIERKYETELVYVQDVSKLPSTQTAVGLNCPNCGAPIRMLGEKTCPFCGTGLIELNLRVWRINATKEMGS